VFAGFDLQRQVIERRPRAWGCARTGGRRRGWNINLGIASRINVKWLAQHSDVAQSKEGRC